MIDYRGNYQFFKISDYQQRNNLGISLYVLEIQWSTFTANTYLQKVIQKLFKTYTFLK